MDADEGAEEKAGVEDEVAGVETAGVEVGVDVGTVLEALERL